ncbi:MAG: DUF5011 domain-containing protein [bacterium]|nr:DUF5011 domain-containing protein [bacterium]
MYPETFTWRHSPGLRRVAIALLFIFFLAPGFAVAQVAPPPDLPPPLLSGPTVDPVSIASNNTSSSLAMPGDVVTLSFTVDIEPLITPSATIAGHDATVLSAGGNSWTASTTMLAGDAEGVITFSAVVGSVDASATTTVEAITSGSDVVFDGTAPVIAAHADVAAEAASSTGATISYTSPTADDGSTVSCSPESGTTFALGTTTVTCNASDAAGNAATPTTFSVSVVDTTAPVITLTGASSQSLTVGDSFTDEGATTADIVDGAGTADVSGSVNTSSAGTYTLTYDKTDAAGNHAAAVTRTVTVNAAPAPEPAPSAGGQGGGSGGSLYPVAPVFSDAPSVSPPSSAPAPQGSVLGAQTTNIVSSAPARIVSSNRPRAIAARAPVPVRNERIETSTPNPAQVAAAVSAASTTREKLEWPAQIATVEYGIGQLESYFPWLLLLLLVLFALIAGSWAWRKYREYREQNPV